jgi:hypothetical protein
VSLASLLTHRVSIVRREAVLVMGEPLLDDYGQPETTEATVSGVPAAIQPKTAHEVALLSQAGAVVSDHDIFMQPIHLTEGAAILHDASDCPVSPDIGDTRYEVTGISNEAGIGHHLKIDARLVGTGRSVVAETGS